MLRCAKCRETWHATPADAAEEAGDAAMAGPGPAAPNGGDVPDDAPSANPIAVDAPLTAKEPKGLAMPGMRRKPKRASKKTSRSIKLTAAHAAAAALAVTLVCGLGFRARVVKALPQTAKLYAAIGMPVNLRGLEFSGLRSELLIDKDQAVLLVEGEITGVAAAGADVPKVTVSLRGPEGREIYAWTSEAGRSTLAKGESTTFRARLASPPGEGRDVVVRFAESDSRVSAH